jgi:hypothetical protein
MNEVTTWYIWDVSHSIFQQILIGNLVLVMIPADGDTFVNKTEKKRLRVWLKW